MSRKRWLWVGGIAVAVLALLGAAAYGLRDTFAFARLATGYAAKQTCSCVHVSGRTLESCIADFPDPAAREELTVMQDGDVVRASALFGVFQSEARFEEEFGCTLLD